MVSTCMLYVYMYLCVCMHKTTHILYAYIYTQTHTIPASDECAIQKHAMDIYIHIHTHTHTHTIPAPNERAIETNIPGIDAAFLAQFRREFGAKDNTSFAEFKKCLSLYSEVCVEICT
jgi:hypothetical protein